MLAMMKNMLVVQVEFSALTNDGPTANLVWPNCRVANCLRILGAVWTLFLNLFKYILYFKNNWSVLKCLLLAPCHFQNLFVVIFMDEISTF